MDYKKIGSFIREERLNKQLTQQELANLLYVDVTTVSKWERGITFPDSSMITLLCSTLGINEHELFQASEDEEYRETKSKFLKIQNSYNLVFKISSFCYVLTVLICFACNLLIDHTLNWFFYVAAGCLAGWTFFPSCLKFVTNSKLLHFVASTLTSLTLLFITCSCLTNNWWCFIATSGTVLGYFILFFPFLYRFHLRPAIGNKWFTLLYFGGIAIITTALLILIYFYGKYNLANGLIILYYCDAPFILAGAIATISRLNRCFRAGLISLESGLFGYGLLGVLTSLLEPNAIDVYSINFLDWDNYNNGNVASIVLSLSLIAASVLLIKGFFSANRKDI